MPHITARISENSTMTAVLSRKVCWMYASVSWEMMSAGRIVRSTQSNVSNGS